MIRLLHESAANHFCTERAAPSAHCRRGGSFCVLQYGFRRFELQSDGIEVQHKVLLLQFRVWMAAGDSELHIPDLVGVVRGTGPKHDILADAVFQVSVLIRFQRRGRKGLFDIHPQGVQITGNLRIGPFDPGAVVPAIIAATDVFGAEAAV